MKCGKKGMDNLKLIPQTVKNCSKCPYQRSNQFLEDCLCTGIRCILTGAELYNLNIVPNWCPLEDAQNEKIFNNIDNINYDNLTCDKDINNENP